MSRPLTIVSEIASIASAVLAYHLYFSPSYPETKQPPLPAENVPPFAAAPVPKGENEITRPETLPQEPAAAVTNADKEAHGQERASSADHQEIRRQNAAILPFEDGPRIKEKKLADLKPQRNISQGNGHGASVTTENQHPDNEPLQSRVAPVHRDGGNTLFGNQPFHFSGELQRANAEIVRRYLEQPPRDW